jgi:hypothetical protein
MLSSFSVLSTWTGANSSVAGLIGACRGRSWTGSGVAPESWARAWEEASKAAQPCGCAVVDRRPGIVGSGSDRGRGDRRDCAPAGLSVGPDLLVHPTLQLVRRFGGSDTWEVLDRPNQVSAALFGISSRSRGANRPERTCGRRQITGSRPSVSSQGPPHTQAHAANASLNPPSDRRRQPTSRQPAGISSPPGRCGSPSG